MTKIKIEDIQIGDTVVDAVGDLGVVTKIEIDNNYRLFTKIYAIWSNSNGAKLYGDEEVHTSLNSIISVTKPKPKAVSEPQKNYIAVFNQYFGFGSTPEEAFNNVCSLTFYDKSEMETILQKGEIKWYKAEKIKVKFEVTKRFTVE